MPELKLYLDNCCFNRPFDDQSQLLVRLETEAKLYIQEGIKNGTFELVWSYILDEENASNPYPNKREQILFWKSLAVSDIEASDEVIYWAKEYVNKGLKSMDALHVACAIAASADYFITTDKGILKKTIKGTKAMNPLDFYVMFQEGLSN
jgi:predicted nucleic acid-binding protein